MSAIARLRAIAPSLKQLKPNPHRPFGSAAAVQYQYDSDDDGDDDEEFLQSAPRGMLDIEGSSPERGVQWVMIGEPRAKRHFFAERLSKLLEVPHISMISLLYPKLNPSSSLYENLAYDLDRGKIVPEKTMFDMLSKRLEEGNKRGETGFILDGLPHTIKQAEILNPIACVDLVVNFKCPLENLMINKLQLRKITSTNSKTLTKPSNDEHLVNAYLNRLEESKILEDYYRKQKKLLNFEVAGGLGETWQGLLSALRLEHINARSSQKLTA